MVRYYHIMKIILGVSLLLVLIASILFWTNKTPEPIVVKSDLEHSISIVTPNGSINAILADTDSSRQHGLSDRMSLPSDYGMLFIFPNPSKPSFWMKDMHFPLDIVWIDEQKKVAGITKDLSPETFPNVFLPPRPIKYVLELNSGQAEKFGLEVGVGVDF